eukprot:gene8969-2966_t
MPSGLPSRRALVQRVRDEPPLLSAATAAAAAAAVLRRWDAAPAGTSDRAPGRGRIAVGSRLSC